MREIKFRAWELNTKQMSKPFGLGGIPIFIVDGEIVGLEIMQFTGLLDKNGKEIYEGDIVFNHSVSREESGEVIFSDIHHSYIIKYKPKKGRSDDWDDMHGDEHNLEKIGNIWENPELLK